MMGRIAEAWRRFWCRHERRRVRCVGYRDAHGPCIELMCRCEDCGAARPSPLRLSDDWRAYQLARLRHMPPGHREVFVDEAV